VLTEISPTVLADSAIFEYQVTDESLEKNHFSTSTMAPLQATPTRVIRLNMALLIRHLIAALPAWAELFCTSLETAYQQFAHNEQAGAINVLAHLAVISPLEVYGPGQPYQDSSKDSNSHQQESESIFMNEHLSGVVSDTLLRLCNDIIVAKAEHGSNHHEATTFRILRTRVLKAVSEVTAHQGTKWFASCASAVVALAQQRMAVSALTTVEVLLAKLHSLYPCVCATGGTSILDRADELHHAAKLHVEAATVSEQPANYQVKSEPVPQLNSEPAPEPEPEVEAEPEPEPEPEPEREPESLSVPEPEPESTGLLPCPATPEVLMKSSDTQQSSCGFVSYGDMHEAIDLAEDALAIRFARQIAVELLLFVSTEQVLGVFPVLYRSATSSMWDTSKITSLTLESLGANLTAWATADPSHAQELLRRCVESLKFPSDMSISPTKSHVPRAVPIVFSSARKLQQATLTNSDKTFTLGTYEAGMVTSDKTLHGSGKLSWKLKLESAVTGHILIGACQLDRDSETQYDEPPRAAPWSVCNNIDLRNVSASTKVSDLSSPPSGATFRVEIDLDSTPTTAKVWYQGTGAEKLLLDKQNLLSSVCEKETALVCFFLSADCATRVTILESACIRKDMDDAAVYSCPETELPTLQPYSPFVLWLLQQGIIICPDMDASTSHSICKSLGALWLTAPQSFCPNILATLARLPKPVLVAVFREDGELRRQLLHAAGLQWRYDQQPQIKSRLLSPSYTQTLLEVMYQAELLSPICSGPAKISEHSDAHVEAFDPDNLGRGFQLSNDGMTMKKQGGPDWNSSLGSVVASEGRWRWDVRVDNIRRHGGNLLIGLANPDTSPDRCPHIDDT
jgi:hypothetical protein